PETPLLACRSKGLIPAYLLFNDSLRSPAELDERFDRVLSDPSADIHRRGEHRFIILSKLEGRLAIVDDIGHRISVYQFTEAELELYKEPL
ncbi:hypothetical protein, partial [Methylomagnum sp.]